jgi:ribonuclease VapC
VIVIDTSAIVAIWENEPEAADLKIQILYQLPGERRVSAASYVEATTVLGSRRRHKLAAWPGEFQRWFQETALDLVPVDGEQARIAVEARIRFGRGFGHPAKLNFGDCFSYALARTLKAPLLYVGDDFGRTDIRPALRRRKARRRS